MVDIIEKELDFYSEPLIYFVRQNYVFFLLESERPLKMLICCRTGGFPSTPNVGPPSQPPSENIQSLTSFFPKNISNLSRRDNNDVATTPSVASCENNKIHQKESVWMKRRSSPISVLELGRKPASYDRKHDCQSSVWSGSKYKAEL